MVSKLKHILLICFLSILSGCDPNSQPPVSPQVSSEHTLLDSLIDKSEELIWSRNYDSAIFLLDRGNLLATELNHIQNKSSISNNYALIHYFRGNLDSSIYYYEQALRLDYQIGDISRIVRRLKNIGIAQRAKGNYLVAIEKYYEAMELADSVGYSREINAINNSLGNLYNQIEEPMKAIEFFTRAKLGWQLSFDSIGLATAFNNLGNSYYSTEEYEKALSNYKSGLELNKIANDRKLIAHSYSNLGKVYLIMNQVDVAERYFKESLSIRDSLRENTGIALVANNLAELYLTQGNYQQCKYYLGLALELSTKYEYTDLLRQNYATWKAFHIANNQFRDALLIDAKHDSLNELDFRVNKLNVVKLQANFDLARKEQEKRISDQTLIITEERNERQQLIINISWLIGAFILVLLIVISRSRLVIQGKNYELRQKNELIEAQKDDIRHRMQNGLNRVRRMLNMLGKELEDDRAIQQLKRGEHMILALSSLEDHLQNESNDTVEVEQYIEQIIYKAIESFSLLDRNIEVVTNIELATLSMKKMVPLSLIISEIVVNALKYSYKDVSDPRLTCRLREEQNCIKFTIEDNGVGFDVDFQESGQGYNLINKLTSYLKGQLEIKNKSSGVEHILTF